MTQPAEVLPRSDPRAQGFDPAAVDNFVKAVDDQQLGVHGVVIVRHGHVVAEESWAPYTPAQRHLMFSATKAFTATAIGLAVAEGKLSLDEPILGIFPSYATPRIRRIMGEVRVRHLLSMASGQVTDTMPLMRNLPEHDWVEIFLSVQPEYPPGVHFLYNSGASHVLSAIVQSRTGQSVHDYLTPRLFEPLGIPDPVVESSPRGVNLGGSGFQLRTEDLAAFGQLYLQRGRWQGRQLLPESWVAEASTSAISTESHENPDWRVGYGFQLWRGRHNSFRADGAFGQFSMVLPDQDAVVALTSGSARTQGILEAVWDQLLPGFSDSTGGEVVPTRRHPELALPLPSSGAAGAVPFLGRPIHLEHNQFGLTDCTLTDDGAGLVFRAHDDGGVEHVIRCGRGSWVNGDTTLWTVERSASPLPVAGRVGTESGDSVSLLWQYVSTPFRRTVTVRQVAEGSVEVSFETDLTLSRARNETVRGRL